MALPPKGTAQRLKTLRQEQGLTMRTLAKKAKTSVGYLAISRPGRSRTHRRSSSFARSHICSAVRIPFDGSGSR